MDKLIEAKAFHIGEHWYICARLPLKEGDAVVLPKNSFTPEVKVVSPSDIEYFKRNCENPFKVMASTNKTLWVPRISHNDIESLDKGYLSLTNSKFYIAMYIEVDRITGNPLKHASPKVRTIDLNIELFNFHT